MDVGIWDKVNLHFVGFSWCGFFPPEINSNPLNENYTCLDFFLNVGSTNSMYYVINAIWALTNVLSIFRSRLFEANFWAIFGPMTSFRLGLFVTYILGTWCRWWLHDWMLRYSRKCSEGRGRRRYVQNWAHATNHNDKPRFIKNRWTHSKDTRGNVTIILLWQLLFILHLRYLKAFFCN